MIAAMKKESILSRFISPTSLLETEDNFKRHPTLIVKMKRMKMEKKIIKNISTFPDDSLHKELVFFIVSGKNSHIIRVITAKEDRKPNEAIYSGKRMDL